MTATLRLGCAESEDGLQKIALALKKARKTVVVTGAGISCNAGIPDFRSTDGLYNMVKHLYPRAVVKGKDLFDAVLFSNPTSVRVFFTFITQLRKSILKAESTATHKLIKMLKDKGRLLRCYTQNIDGLEKDLGLETGIDDNWRSLDVVQLHGDIHSLKCMLCACQYAWTEASEQLLGGGEAPECPACSKAQAEREEKGKRCINIGHLRPNIVLYGEEHPNGELIGRCTSRDLRSKPDMLIIVGTSLKVTGIRKLVKDMAKAVKDRDGLVVFVNNTGVSGSTWREIIDYHVSADCDEWVNDVRARVPNFFLNQSKIPDYAVTQLSNSNPKKRQSAAKGGSPCKKKKKSIKIPIKVVLNDIDEPPNDCPPLSQSSTVSEAENWSYEHDTDHRAWNSNCRRRLCELDTEPHQLQQLFSLHDYHNISVKQEYSVPGDHQLILPPISELTKFHPAAPSVMTFTSP
jgi:NAD-dependent histone deacetylase SIR2